MVVSRCLNAKSIWSWLSRHVAEEHDALDTIFSRTSQWDVASLNGNWHTHWQHGREEYQEIQDRGQRVCAFIVKTTIQGIDSVKVFDVTRVRKSIVGTFNGTDLSASNAIRV